MPDYLADAGLVDTTQTAQAPPDYLGDAGVSTDQTSTNPATPPMPTNTTGQPNAYYKDVVGNPEVNPDIQQNTEPHDTGVNPVVQPIKTADEWLNTAFNTPFQVGKSALAANAYGESPLQGAKEGLTGQGPTANVSMGDLLDQDALRNANESPVQSEINQNYLGPAMELADNPINAADLAMPGATKLAGGAIDYLGDAAKAGATKLGNTSVIQKAASTNIPLLDTTLQKMVDNLNDFVSNMKQSMRPYTANPEFNQMAQNKDLLNSYTAQKVMPQTEEEQKQIRDAAIQHLKPAEGLKEGSKKDIAERVNRLQKMILDAWEPEGSQLPTVGHNNEVSLTTPKTGETIFPNKNTSSLIPDEQLQQQARQQIIDQQKRENMAKLPYDVQGYAQHAMEQQKARALVNQQKVPDFNERLNYAQHNFTPEMTDFLNKNFNNTDRPLVTQALTDLGRNNVKARGVPTTINELNNVAAAGKLSKQEGLGGWKLLDQFKQPVFNENAVDLAASSNLKSVHAENHYDFMQQVAQNFGKTREQVLNSPTMSHMTLVKDPVLKLLHPDGLDEMYFPKEIGDYLNRGKELAHNQGGIVNKIMHYVGTVMKGTSDLTKRVNFGMWPGSMAKIYADNNMLAYMGGIWHPESMYKGFDLASDLRRPNLALDDRKVFVSTPRDVYTKKQVMDLAQRYGGVGMGRAKAELQSINPGRPEVAPMKGMWAMHNFVEDSTRLGGFIEALRQGKTPEEAGALARKVFYDYSAMGPMDKTFQKYIPFYIFARKNIPAMVKMALTKPGQASLPERIRQQINRPIQNEQNLNTETQEGNKPLNVGNGYTMNAKMFMPETAYNEMLGSGKTPTEAFLNTRQKMFNYGVGMINPILRTTGEEFSGKNWETGQPIQRMTGEVGAQIGGVNIPKLVTYPFEQAVRPVNEFKNAVNPNKEDWQKGLRLGTNINVNKTDPNQQELNYVYGLINSIKGQGGKTGGIADVEYYARQLAEHAAQGPKYDEGAANKDRANLKIAIEHLKQAAGATK